MRVRETRSKEGRKEGGRLGRWQHFLIRAIKDRDDGLVISLTLRTFLQHTLLVLFIPFFCPVIVADMTAKEERFSGRHEGGGAAHMTLNKRCIACSH